MKKIFVLIPFLILSMGFLDAQTPVAIQLSSHIAQKMKDSLNLTAQEQNKIYGINMRLYHEKMAARQRFKDPDLLRANTQRIENTRDSLYHKVLPDDKYELYKQKKRNLVSAN
jgi:hypothetical protein